MQELREWFQCPKLRWEDSSQKEETPLFCRDWKKGRIVSYQTWGRKQKKILPHVTLFYLGDR